MGLFAHGRVLENRLHGLDQQHQDIGRGDDHPRPVGLLDNVLEFFVEVRIDRFGRHEHDGGLVGLAGDQVFFRNVLHMLADVAPQPYLGGANIAFALGLAERIERLQRKLGIDH